MMKSVASGEKITKEHFTAEWYNKTLEIPPPSRKHKAVQHLPSGFIYGALPTGQTVEKEAVAVTDHYLSNSPFPTPILSMQGITPFNWGVSLENKSGSTNGNTVASNLICIQGITFANVTRIDDTDQCVTYSLTNNRLETAPYGKAQLLSYSEGEPSLICIGTCYQATRIVGHLLGAINGEDVDVGIGTLRGINGFAETLGNTITARNIHKFTSDSGAVVRAEYVYENCRWEIYQADCAGVEPAVFPSDCLLDEGETSSGSSSS